MITLFSLLGIILAIGIGIFKKCNQNIKIKRSIEFAKEYQVKFSELADGYLGKLDKYNKTHIFDESLYIWLTKNATKIQHDTGQFGVIRQYSAPYSSFIHENYEMIVNTLPKFRNCEIDQQEIHYVDDCLIRYIGFQEEQEANAVKNIMNPIVLFSIGIQEVLSIPLRIVFWFGIYDNRTLYKIKNSLIFKVVSMVFALIVFLSGVITIIQGYEQTIAFFKSIFHLSK